jgi:hypothetical protein
MLYFFRTRMAGEPRPMSEVMCAAARRLVRGIWWLPKEIESGLRGASGEDFHSDTWRAHGACFRCAHASRPRQLR